MNATLTTIRTALRTLRRAPAHTALVLTTLGIGAGASTAIFSAVNELMLKPLPLPDPHQLVMLWESNEAKDWDQVHVAPANALDWKEQVPSIEDIALVREDASSLALTAGDRTVGLTTTTTTGNLFGVLRAAPLLGRTFTDDETWEGSTPVVVLSHGAWVRHFASDSGVIGRLVRLDGAAHEVIGVMRPTFRYPMNEAEAWTTFRWSASLRTGTWFRRAHVVRAIGRLRPGASTAIASRELAAVAARLETEYPATNEGNLAGLTPLRDFLVGERRTPLLLLLGASGLLLLVVCANVANLSLARAMARRHELCVRSALGASAGRLARLVFAENACLAVGGACLGLAAGWLGLTVISALRPDGLAELAFQFDWRVFGFAAGVASLSALLFGLQPALLGARTDVKAGLEGRQGISSSGRSLLGAHVLSAVELALAVVLVVSAGLLVRSMANLRGVDPGVRLDGVLTFEVSAPGWKYRINPDLLQLSQRLLERIESVPGVAAAGAARSIPFTGQGWTSEFTVEGWPADRFGIEVRHRQVSPGYFEALRVPLRQGTVFSDPVGPGAPTMVVVNQAFADQWFPGESPLGRRLAYTREPGPDAQWVQVVGVVGNERLELEVDPLPEVIEPLAMDPPQLMRFVVRHEGPLSSMAAPLRTAIAAVEPEAPVLALRTMRDVALDALAAERYVIAILVAFAVVALVVASIGVYGVASQAAGLRTHEVGIRIALGAGPAEVLRAMMWRGLAFTGLGVLAGVAATFGTGRFIRTQLFRVEPTDPVTLLVVAVLLASVAIIAMLIPARRALRTDPVRVLRGK